jgi:YbbR domain-containing protein
MKGLFVKAGKRLQRWSKNFVRKDLVLRLLSVFFAMLIWGYVITIQNPSRNKTLTDVSVKFEGEADLNARDLVIRGNKTDLLKNVTATVTTPLDKYAQVTAQDVECTINLSNIGSPGTYTLRIDAQSYYGEASASPASVQVEIDELEIKQIPVEIHTEGTLPDGYWMDDMAVSQQMIEIRGAKIDIEKVTKAVGILSLTNRTESYNDAISLKLVDADGNEVPNVSLVSDIPAVNVKMTIQPKKTVGFNIVGAIIGSDNIAANYEIASIKTIPESVEITGSREALESIVQLDLESLDISGASGYIFQTLAIKVPEGITILGSENVNVYISIKEKTETVAFQDIGIQVIGTTSKSDYSISTSKVDVSVSGPYSKITKLTRKDIKLVVDITDLSPGQYVLQVQTGESDKLSNDMTVTPGTETVTITIRR